MAAKKIDHEVAQRLVKAADIVVLTISAMVLTLRTNAAPQVQSAIGFIALLIALSAVLAMRESQLYAPATWSNGIKNTLKSIVVALLAGLIPYVLAPFVGLALDFTWFKTWTQIVTSYFGLTRLFGAFIMSRGIDAVRFKQRIVIVGGGKAAEEAIRLLERSSDLDTEIIGLFDDRFDNRSPKSIRRHKKIGKIADLDGYAREHHVDLVIVAIPMSAEQRLLHILKRLWVLPVDIRISAATAQLRLSPKAYTYLGELPLLNAFERPLNGWDAFLKSTMDKTIALLAIVALAPAMLAIALAIKMESNGPVIFKQKRFGFNNELFEVFKFRSMYVEMSDATAAKLVTKGDPRVTRVGRIIRKTSLDELPQLFNVLFGSLSLVGPRPHAAQAKAAGTIYDQVVDGYFARHKVKPGLTGWAQINGWRGETDTREKLEQRVKHDLEYIDRWSLGFDLQILVKTPLALLRGENAY